MSWSKLRTMVTGTTFGWVSEGLRRPDYSVKQEQFEERLKFTLEDLESVLRGYDWYRDTSSDYNNNDLEAYDKFQEIMGLELEDIPNNLETLRTNVGLLQAIEEYPPEKNIELADYLENIARKYHDTGVEMRRNKGHDLGLSP